MFSKPFWAEIETYRNWMFGVNYLTLKATCMLLNTLYLQVIYIILISGTGLLALKLTKFDLLYQKSTRQAGQQHF